MGLVVITGGARSGKSSVAEEMAMRCTHDITVVVFGDGESDSEMASRIARHQDDRPEEWKVVEARDSVEWTERVGDGVLIIDCLGTLLGMVMLEVLVEQYGTASFDGIAALSDEYAEECERRFAAIIAWLLKRIDSTIVVTNEVGSGVIPDYPSARIFRDVLGRANRSLVKRADRAYLVVCGRLIDLLELPDKGIWPWHEKGCD